MSRLRVICAYKAYSTIMMYFRVFRILAKKKYAGTVLYSNIDTAGMMQYATPTWLIKESRHEAEASCDHPLRFGAE